MYKITVLFLAVNFMVEAANWKDICTKNNCGKCSKIIVKGKGDKSKIQLTESLLIKNKNFRNIKLLLPLLGWFN